MDLLTKEEASRIAEAVAAGEGVRLLAYELSDRSEEALGYMGKHLTLTLDLASEAGMRRRRLFLKTYEVSGHKEDFLGKTGIFQREQDFYEVVLRDMKECAGELDWCPEYHFSKERVLGDLSEEGFRMVEDGRGLWALDEAHLESALGALASMHSASMLLEQRRAELLPDTYPTIFGREMLYDEYNLEAPSRKWITWQIQDLLEGVEYLDKYSQADKTLIRTNFGKLVMRIYGLSKKSDKYRNVLTHGDMWRNNLLFLYSNEGLPKDCKLVDFQFIRYAPPAHDIMHLLCYATSGKMRRRTQSRFLQLYYEKLRERLKSKGVDVEKELGPQELVESCKEYQELALIQCLLSLHYILGPASLKVEAESYERYEEYLTNHRKGYVRKFFNDRSYAEKITDIFQELIDTYILGQSDEDGVGDGRD